MKRYGSLGGIMVLGIAVLTGHAMAATWDGAPDGGGSSANLNWSTGQNWVGDTAPANPTADMIVFGNQGVVTDATVTSVMDVNWAIGGLTVTHTNRNHNLDIGAGRRLTVNGDTIVGYNTNNATSIGVTNGTLQLGTTATNKNLVVGRRDWSYPKPTATITLNNVVLEPHLSNFWVGVECSMEVGVNGTLDLQNATIAGGKLSCREFAVGTGPGGNGTVKLSTNTGLTAIEAVSQFQLGARTTVSGSYKAYGGVGKIGVGPNFNVLPPNVDITLGAWGTTRCTVGIGMAAWADAGMTYYPQLVAASGGVFTGYIDTMTIGQRGKAQGTLNISNMTSVAIDANTIQISQTGPDNDTGKGYIYLPPGTVTTRYLVVSPEATNTVPTGVFQLNDTTCTILSNVTFGRNGTIEANIKGQPSGLDLAAAATLTSTTNGGAGKINLIFKQNPATREVPYWGLRWAGDHVTELASLVSVGKLTWDDTTYLTAKPRGTCKIWAESGYTYVGITAIPHGTFIMLK